MLAHWFLAAVHLLAYALALWAVLSRATALRKVTADGGGVRSVLLGYEKGTEYYLHQPLFHLKMTLFVVVLLLEIAPMVALIKWRIALARKTPLNVGRTGLYARICHIEALLVVLMVVAASGMARGVTFG